MTPSETQDSGNGRMQPSHAKVRDAQVVVIVRFVFEIWLFVVESTPSYTCDRVWLGT